MDALDKAVQEMDLQFFAEGKHGVSLEEATDFLKSKKECLFLDVRTEEEISYLRFNNVKEIPINQLPDRVQELPDDRTIIVFCSSIVRASMAALYLRAEGKTKVRTLLANSEAMVALSSPSLLAESSNNCC